MKRRDTYTKRNPDGNPSTFNERLHGWLKSAVSSQLAEDAYVVSFHSSNPIFVIQKKIGHYFTNAQLEEIDTFIDGALAMVATLSALKQLELNV